MVENIQLSESFFQEFSEDPEFANPTPTLQIIQSRVVDSGAICMRLRCSDGVFSYISCGFAASLKERIEEEGIGEPDRFPIIKVLEYLGTKANDKSTLVIRDYELLAIDVPKIGNPTSHTGDPEPFRGVAGAKRKLNQMTPSNVYSTATPKKMARMDEACGPVLPINGISPYMSGRWRICGVVSNKEELRQINAKKGPMKVFSFVLFDKDSQSIKITAFAETAEKFFPQIEENKRYYVTGTPQGIKPANKRFNATGHDYEITLNHDSTIEESSDQNCEAPKFILKKVALNQIASMPGQMVDVLAIIDKIEDVVNVKAKDGRDLIRRNIMLIDESATLVALTLWGDQAVGFNADCGRVMGIKGASVREFNSTFSLSINSGSRIEIDPENKDTETLLQWYESERPNAEVNAISNSASAGSANFALEARFFATWSNVTLFLHFSDRGIYFSNVGFIASFRSENAIYKACSSPNCSKKVQDQGDGFYRCDKCNTSSKTFIYRYMVSMEVADPCGSTWVTLFDDKASAFLGKTATELGELQTTDPNAYKAIFDSKLFGYHFFRCRAKEENYNDVNRIKTNVYEIRQPNFEQYSQGLDILLEKLEAL